MYPGEVRSGGDRVRHAALCDGDDDDDNDDRKDERVQLRAVFVEVAVRSAVSQIGDAVYLFGP